eukprot:TRINITY_DN16996_c0_g1_i2.p1 TRINITY_DN16996_c0_g1~~TRINITY_DN16996_c0_g1_i2.p1  ORF type:complete len:144 (+),score=14.18 TRINITY_DN16996_c0_g1_i2:73-504(+)
MSGTTAVAVLSFIGGLLTFVVGVFFVCESLKTVDLSTKCDFLDRDCNKSWRDTFSLAPDDFVKLWTPVLLGFLVVSMHVNALRLWMPRSNMMLGVVMVFVGVFGAVGYMGLFGVISGFVCLASGLVCLVAHAIGHRDPALLSV